MKNKFTKVGGFIACFLLTSYSLYAQNGFVSGVVDDGSSPLTGVSVVLKESGIGTSTDISGKFQIRAKEGQILVFTVIGYETKEMVLGSENNIHVSLKQELS